LHLSEHSKVHKKDKHSNRGLIMAISTRKKLLTYLKRTNETHYKEVLAKLGLRK
jgi:small subunit ribosomal protein S15